MDKNDVLVERILRLSRDPLLRTSGAESIGAPELDSPVEPEAIAAAEAVLGFKLPELLRQLYLRVGNGGFGPNHGIIGLEDGYPEDLSGACLPELYQYYRELADEKLDFAPWPEKLLPLFVVGCGLVDSVDCSTANYLVVKKDVTTDFEPQVSASMTGWKRGQPRWSRSKPSNYLAKKLRVGVGGSVPLSASHKIEFNSWSSISSASSKSIAAERFANAVSVGFRVSSAMRGFSAV